MKNSFLTKALKAFLAITLYSDKKTKNHRIENKNIGLKTYETILSPIKLGTIELKNRVVMAPMTRCRASDNRPNMLMEHYYKQRSGAGLIITEGISPSPCGLGYARMPGIFDKQQVSAWENITSAVHKEGSKIFAQLMHTGRIGHPLNMTLGTKIIAPSAIKASGQIWTDSKQMQDYLVPKQMDTEDIWQTTMEYVLAAQNAIDAGFDGVELQAASGYLLEQFLSPHSNSRQDSYGGNIENRCRFVLEIVNAVAKAIGKNKTAIRISPYGLDNGMQDYFTIDATYQYLAEKLNEIGLVYLHLANYTTKSIHNMPFELKNQIRGIFKNTIILSGNYNLIKADADIQSGLGDMVAFGRLFINNPDLVDRIKNNWPLSQNLKADLFYTDDEKGYTDYPIYPVHHKTTFSMVDSENIHTLESVIMDKASSIHY